MTAQVNTAPSQSISRRGRRGQSEETPKSMQVPSNNAAFHGVKEEDLDFPAIVRGCAVVSNKANGSVRITSSKSKNHVFVLACNAVRSQLNLPKFDAEQKPVRLPDHLAKRVREAMETVWSDEFKKFIVYGGPVEQSDLSINWDLTACKVVPMIDDKGNPVLNAAGKQKLDINVRAKAVAKVTRAPKDIAESILFCSLSQKSAAKRLETMQERVGAYTRDEIREQQDKLTAYDAKMIELHAEKARMTAIIAGVQALEVALSKGEITSEQYAAKRAEIETKPV